MTQEADCQGQSHSALRNVFYSLSEVVVSCLARDPLARLITTQRYPENSLGQPIPYGSFSYSCSMCPFRILVTLPALSRQHPHMNPDGTARHKCAICVACSVPLVSCPALVGLMIISLRFDHDLP